MKTLALAGLMTISAVAGSAITLSLSQTSFAQDSQADDGHWTEQHPAGTAHAQQQAAQSAQYAQKQHYTEYKVVRVAKGKSSELGIAVSNEMKDGWQPVGGFFVSCSNWDCTYFQSLAR